MIHLVQIFTHPTKPWAKVWQNSVAGYDYTIEFSNGNSTKNICSSYDAIKKNFLDDGYNEILGEVK